MKSVRKLVRQNLNPGRWALSRRHAKTLDFLQPGFDLDGWVRFYEFLGIPASFVGIPIPVLHKHMTHFRKYVIPVVEEVNLPWALDLAKRIALELGATLKVDPEIEGFAKAYNDRRYERPYFVRYQDDPNRFNFFNGQVSEVLERNRPQTMRLTEALLRFAYYIIVHHQLQWDDVKDIVCPETCIRDQYEQVIKVAVFKVDESNQLDASASVKGFEDLRRLKPQSVVINASIRFKPVSEGFSWGEKAIEVVS